jgi:sugar lactone lactonase YvrE
MMRTSLVILGSAACGLLACGGGGGSGGGGPDGGGPPAFTNGVSTLAGSSDAGKNDGPRDVARFNNPVNVAVGPDGKIYVADFDNSEIRSVDRDGNVDTIIAKQGFVRPFGLAFAQDGTLYVSTDNDDSGNHNLMSGTVWRVDVHAKTATVVVRGIGRPRGLATLPDGRLVLSDDLHHLVRLLDPATGNLTTLAGAWDVMGYADGTGATARFSTPYGVAVRSDGTIVLADYDNERIRVLTTSGAVTTLAGNGTAGYADGAMGQAGFHHPQGVAVAPNGDIYVSDADNFRVRRLSGSTVDTVAGNGTSGYLDNDDKLAAQFFGLEGLAVAPDGMIFVADGNRGDPLPYNRVRQIKMN